MDSSESEIQRLKNIIDKKDKDFGNLTKNAKIMAKDLKMYQEKINISNKDSKEHLMQLELRNKMLLDEKVTLLEVLKN